MHNTAAAILCSLSLPDGPTAPDWILLVPAGDIRTRDGRAFSNRKPELAVAAFLAERKDIPVDYEHATHLRAPKGQSAPAVAA